LDGRKAETAIKLRQRVTIERAVSVGLDVDQQELASQIRIAAGLPISEHVLNSRPRHHSIECRINAEDPYNNFAPSPGKITHWYAPGGRGVRVDTHVYSGYSVPPYYDSMIAKLIVTGATRDIAIRRMRRALGEFMIQGIKTTIPLQSKIITTSDFQNGNYDIAWVENYLSHEGMKG
jgi:acetyl-CoA carboxylase biotin carboxylase subunit